MKTKFFTTIVLLWVLMVATAMGQHTTVKTIKANGVSFNMVFVEGGPFTMGADVAQGSNAQEDELPSHTVVLRNYYIGETEVTQAIWNAVMGNNPSYFQDDNRPVERVL